MDVARNVNFDLTIIKEPRGFLRVIQFVLSILAFATVCTSVTITLTVQCDDSFTQQDVLIVNSYPFNMKTVEVVQPFCVSTSGQTTGTPFQDMTSFASASQFFCFLGVMSFLLCIAYCLAYTMFGAMFAKDSTPATVDFIFSAVWTVLWFIASTAWADNLATMTGYLNIDYIIVGDLNTTQYCAAPRVAPGGCGGESGNNATLVVSVLFGYLNMLIWGAGLWFLFKETRWHKDPQSATQNYDDPAVAGTGGDGTYQAPDKSGNNIY